MGQKLVGTCCTSAAESEAQAWQVDKLDNAAIVVHGLGTHADLGKAIFADDGIACNVSQAEVLAPKCTSCQGGAADEIVKEVTDNAGRPCFTSCWRSSAASACRRDMRPADQPPVEDSSGAHRIPFKGDAVDDGPVDMEEARLKDDLKALHARAAADAKAAEFGTHYCSSPGSAPESEWNSAALISELNARAISLTMEFAPMPVVPASYDAHLNGGVYKRRVVARTPSVER
mmetsp:Transcript_53078/g.119617  ORF Transcript_53078/g.119617 Transcript_53078/m.119617 type:complete len:231 (-) Transcript_53078:74-766(-)